MKISRLFSTALLLASLALIAHQTPSGLRALTGVHRPQADQLAASGHRRLAQSMQVKLDHIQQNGQLPRPDQTPTVMTEEEVNDYIAAGNLILPQGVKKLRLEGRSAIVTALLNVDFDEIRAGQRTSNPLLSIFSGQHDVRVEADALGSGGQGRVHVREVSIDGISVPRMALEYFVGKYISPKYPNIGIDSQFQLPDKVDTAIVGYHKLSVTQK